MLSLQNLDVPNKTCYVKITYKKLAIKFNNKIKTNIFLLN